MEKTQDTDPDRSIANQIGETIPAVQQRVDAALAAAERPLGSARLVAVSKMQPLERVVAALGAGHRLFGENRIQEAQRRWAGMAPQEVAGAPGGLRAAFPDLVLHLIGPLQTNKVKDAVGLFDVIETVDRPKLARALATEMDRVAHRVDCLIQVNTGEEEQKAGVTPDGLADLLSLCRDELGLPVRGLMCIPPVDEPPALHFALLAELADRYGLKELSMGMSGDFETAIRHGATLVRVGTALFGERLPRG